MFILLALKFQIRDIVLNFYSCDFCYLTENSRVNSETLSTISSEANMDGSTCELKSDSEEVSQARERSLSEMTLLDLYSGCGAMSTGLCLGAKMSGVNLVTVCYILPCCS